MRRRTALRPAVVRVPQLVGLAVRAAQDLALDAGLFPVRRLPDRGGSAGGTVIRQSPAAGRAVARSTRVMLWVDSGPPHPDDGGDDGGGGGGGGGSRLPNPPEPKVPAGTK